jgi:hypothetical protein
MGTITRKIVCEISGCYGKSITWHPATPSDPREFWSCDLCGAIQNIDPPATGYPCPDPFIKLDINFNKPDKKEENNKEKKAEESNNCFCVGPPHKNCPIHGENI